MATVVTDNSYSVYMHISPKGKRYIGITKRNPVKRWGYNGYCYRHNEYFYRAINKYGWDNFQHLILYSCLSKEDAESIEIELIAKYKTTNNKYGYNIENGGNTIGTHSKETRRKISEWHKGRRLSDESRQKISKANKGKKAWNKGKAWSEDFKKDNALKQKRKPVLCIETNVYYIGLSEASRKTGIDISSISRACKGITQRAGGYHWKFIVEEEQKCSFFI